MIFDIFIKKGLKVQPEVTDDKYLMVDDGAVEVETGEFIYGMIRRLKPQRVLSTGVYTGISDLYTAQALVDNGFGTLDAIEFSSFHLDRAKELWRSMGVADVITPILSDSMKFKPQERYQFMFLDTEPFLRFKELVNFYEYLDDGGYVFVHDMPRGLCQGNTNPDHPDFPSWPVGDLPDVFVSLVKQRKLVPFYFAGARGLVGFYKVHKDDYGFH